MKHRAGFTLLELLLAATIMLILLGALGGVFQNTTQAYEALDESATQQQSRAATLEQLRYEVSLAGFRGTTEADYGNNSLGNPLSVSAGTSNNSDQITVKYLENRTYGSSSSKEQKSVTFTVDPQTHTLTRTQSGTTQAIAAGVKKLKVARYVLKGITGTDCSPSCAAAPPANTVGIILSLTFTDESTQRIPITLLNPVS